MRSLEAHRCTPVHKGRGSSFRWSLKSKAAAIRSTAPGPCSVILELRQGKGPSGGGPDKGTRASKRPTADARSSRHSTVVAGQVARKPVAVVVGQVARKPVAVVPRGIPAGTVRLPRLSDIVDELEERLLPYPPRP
jgi:hypothetical protein